MGNYDNISFDYPVSVGLFESVMDSSLHMPLHKPSTSSIPVESIEGAVLLIPTSKEGQLPIVFGKAQLQRSAIADSSSDSDTPQFFLLCATSAPYDEENRVQPEAWEGPEFRKRKT